MKVTLNIDKKYFYSIVAVLIIVGAIIAVNAFIYPGYSLDGPDPGHGGNNVWIRTASGEKTLQQAIDDGDLLNVPNHIGECTSVSTTFASGGSQPKFAYCPERNLIADCDLTGDAITDVGYVEMQMIRDSDNDGIINVKYGCKYECLGSSCQFGGTLTATCCPINP